MGLLQLAPLAARGEPVEAKPADAFVESCGVCTHLPYTDEAYCTQWPTVRQRLIDLGIRHVRDGGASADVVEKYRDLARHGVRVIWILDPGAGVVPTPEFWSASGSPRQLVVPFLKKMGTNVVSAVEVMNEIDLFYKREWIKDYSQAGYFYKAGSTDASNHLSDDTNSPVWWGRYIVAMARAASQAMKGDDATAQIPIIGPSFGAFHSTPPTGTNSLRDFVDWGCFHTYPFGGNPFSDRAGYGSVDWYIGHGQQPSGNIDEWPVEFAAYQPAFGGKPMAATETGWFTGTASKAVSEAAQAKYVPRLYLEYFRKGIVRCCHYELLDEGTDPANDEQNRGLLRADLSPKPAYTALRNLLRLLSDPGPAMTAGKFDYAIAKQMPRGYNRPQYVRDLLLEKRDGTFWLVLWHEIASSSFYTADGREIKGVARDIAHPDVTVNLTFNTPVAEAAVYFPNSSPDPAATHQQPSSLSLPVNDTPVLVKLTPAK